MTEIKKLTKIALIVDVIIWLLFGIMMLFFFDLTLNTEGWTNPFHVRAFGAMCLITAVFVIFMLRKNEWEEIKFTYVYMLCMCIAVFIVEASILAVLGSTFIAATVSQMIFDLIMMSAKLALTIIAYVKQ